MANPQHHDIIAIGASAGGVEALTLLTQLLPKLDASIFVVVHTGPAGPGMLAKLLSQRGKWPAEVAENDAPIEPGRVYVAPPDRHLVLESDRMRLLRGPLENRHRPAVDALFRTAAAAFGSRVIGVVLTGYLDDGTAGANAIKRRGGIVIAQHPEDAMVPGMPESVIANTQVDYIVPLQDMPALLTRLVGDPLSTADQKAAEHPMSVSNENVDPTGTPSAYTCPECSGTLWEVNDQGLLRFACRVGHSLTADSMMEDQTESAERALWAALRALQERADLSTRMARRAEERGHSMAAQRYIEMAESAAHDATVLRNLLTNGKPAIKERHDPGVQQQSA